MISPKDMSTWEKLNGQYFDHILSLLSTCTRPPPLSYTYNFMFMLSLALSPTLSLKTKQISNKKNKHNKTTNAKNKTKSTHAYTQRQGIHFCIGQVLLGIFFYKTWVSP